jgi:hypothetical protein
MSMESREDSDREPSGSPALLDHPPVPEGTLTADGPSQPTVVDGLQQLRWIHVPIILVMAILGMLVVLRWQTRIAGSFQLYDALYLLSLPYVALGIWGLLTRTPPLPADPQRTLDRLIICLVTNCTVRVVELEMEPTMAEMVVLPVPVLLARPEALMVATLVAEELQIARFVTLEVLPSAKSPVAVYWPACPRSIVSLMGASVIELSVAEVTVRVVLAVMELRLAVIVV